MIEPSRRYAFLPGLAQTTERMRVFVAVFALVVMLIAATWTVFILVG